MRISRWSTLASMFLALVLSVPAWATRTALPGTLNYVEGNASFGTQALDSKLIGSAELQTGQSLATENGKAEMLLTPGVYLRAGDNSSVRLISPSLIDTRVAVDQGEAMVEVDELHPENDIRVTQDGETTQLVKTGLYDFDADTTRFRVFDRQALVQEGDSKVPVKSGHQVPLNWRLAKQGEKFDKDEYEQSDLYRWSSLRSSYLAEANVDAARIYVGMDGPWGPGWIGAGWYWDPWFCGLHIYSGRRIFLQSVRLGILFAVVGVSPAVLLRWWVLPQLWRGLPANLCLSRALCGQRTGYGIPRRGFGISWRRRGAGHERALVRRRFRRLPWRRLWRTPVRQRQPEFLGGAKASPFICVRSVTAANGITFRFRPTSPEFSRPPGPELANDSPENRDRKEPRLRGRPGARNP